VRSEASGGKRLVGWLALLAPVPLPFNDTLEWPLLGIYGALLGWWLLRVYQDRFRPLPRWVVNVLALAYVPLFMLDVTGWSRGLLLRPILHLLLFALLVKMFGMRREKEVWQIMLTAFFVFVASMATSVHPAVVLYLVGWLALAMLTMARMTWAQTLAGYGVRGQDAEAAPFVRLAAGTTLATLVLAVPLFFGLPRTGSPIVTGPAVGGEGGGLESGMTDVVGLDAIGRIRQSHSVVMRMEQTPATPDPASIRFKVASYAHYEAASWSLSGLRRRALQATGDGLVLLRHTPPVAWAELWIQPLGTSHVPMPLRAVAVSRDVRGLAMDSAGGLYLFYTPSGTLHLKVGLSRIPGNDAPAPNRTDDAAALLDTSEVTPRMAQLAQRVAGDRPPAEAAAALESYLSTRYQYSTDLVAGTSGNPLEDFLFETRRGHCEYFASSMVLLLRSLGIPARLVTGFLGAELNPIEDYLIVRQSNAHAWVEAWLPGHGWTTFDPTPPAGRPHEASVSLSQMLSQAWDLLVFRWDRYVLGYGLNDQVGVFWRLRDLLSGMKSLFRHWSWNAPGPSSHGRQPSAAVPPPGEITSLPARQAFPWWSLVPVMVALVAAALWLRRRQTRTATAAWVELLTHARRLGQALASSTPPLAAGRRLERAFPAVSGSIHRLLEGYLAESFAGATVNFGRLEDDLHQALREMRR